MRLSGLPTIRAAFKAMVDLLTPNRLAAHIDLHSYDPQESAASSGGGKASSAATAEYTQGISTSPAVGSSSKPRPEQTATKGGAAGSSPPPRRKDLPEGAIVVAPTMHATDRAIIVRLQYVYYTLWGSVHLPFHSIVRLYIKEASVSDEGAAPLEEHRRYKVVRHEDLLYGHDLLSWRNGGPAGGLFSLMRGANGAIFYVLYSVFGS
jgi:hypothetical protein